MDRPITSKAIVTGEKLTKVGIAEGVPWSRYVLFATIAIVGCTADLVTKAWCFSSPRLRSGEIIWQWPGHAGIQLSRNPGALFGLGAGMVGFFAVLSIIAAIAIPVWLFRFRAARDGWLTAALGCVMAGVLGNLYDRLGFSGDSWLAPGMHEQQAVHFVRDWVLWQWNDRWRWPNFNIADSLLVIGVGVLVLHSILHSAHASSSSR
ncbi:MAG TPA: signal peptidase II [Lacipirellulaceae bacterium]|nr:signal peptidase II [Lacipirellulaceae bacterium]